MLFSQAHAKVRLALLTALSLLLFPDAALHAQFLPPGIAPDPSNKPADPAALGKKVLAFCQSQIGKKVGDGECATLAGEALTASGGRRISGGSPGPDDYVWGDLACVIESQGKTNYDRETQARKVLPGDIIQFRDVEFSNSFDGASHSSNAGHHTAVVVAVTGYGKQIQILEQNAGGHRFVTKGTLNIDEMHKGWMRIYHPVGGG